MSRIMSSRFKDQQSVVLTALLGLAADHHGHRGSSISRRMVRQTEEAESSNVLVCFDDRQLPRTQAKT